MNTGLENSVLGRPSLWERRLGLVAGGQFGRWIKRYIKKIVPDWLIAIRHHRRKHGQFPRLLRPQTFNEKVLHRMLFDRRPILSQVADKAGVRAFVEERLGRSLLPECYHLTADVETIPFDELPDSFVVKPTHGSGWVEIVTDKRRWIELRLKKYVAAGWVRAFTR
jgi:TupA-like ATPgrasp